MYSGNNKPMCVDSQSGLYFFIETFLDADGLFSPIDCIGQLHTYLYIIIIY